MKKVGLSPIGLLLVVMLAGAIVLGGIYLYFAYQPQNAPDATGMHCGGFIRNAPTCPANYHCQLNISSPDTGGVCEPGAPQ